MDPATPAKNAINDDIVVVRKGEEEKSGPKSRGKIRHKVILFFCLVTTGGVLHIRATEYVRKSNYLAITSTTSEVEARRNTSVDKDSFFSHKQQGKFTLSPSTASNSTLVRTPTTVLMNTGASTTTDVAAEKTSSTKNINAYNRDDVDNNTTLLERTSQRLAFFFMHIPKTGGYFVHNALGRLLFQSPEYEALVPYKERFRHCNIGTGRLAGRPVKSKDAICTFIMSELHYNVVRQEQPPIPHVYTIIRDPRQHVLSQYFHCAESKDHSKKKHLMPPSLDAWLESWVKAVDDTQVARQNQRFACYDPRNLQSAFGAFRVDDGVKGLNRQYTVVGDMARIEKSVCVIFIHYAGWVPRQCNCTDVPQQRRLSDHGVTHHGASYVTTPRQDELISNLTRSDVVLYDFARLILDEKVKTVQDDYNVRICEVFRKDKEEEEQSPSSPGLFPIDCACPKTCNATVLPKNYASMPFACEDRIRYLMERYGINETDACVGATTQGACPVGCDPNGCHKL